MKPNSITLAIAFATGCSLWGSPVIAGDNSERVAARASNQAFTGLVLTPNAQVVKSGDFSFTFAKGQPYADKIAELDGLNFSVGLFQGLEANGRIVTKTYHDNIYADPSNAGIRDLSASFKYQIPNFYGVPALDFAVGVQDLGGAANHFETFYGVADYTFDAIPLRTSLGYGSSKLQPEIMNGVFGGVEYQPFEFLQLVGEYDSVSYNAMIKLTTPENFLPLGATASLGHQIVSGHDDIEQDMWQAQFTLPLDGKFVTEPTALNNDLSLKDKLLVAQQQAQSASLAKLQAALIEEGFLNIRVGKKAERLVLMLEDRRYHRNQVDGLGVALGIISSHYSELAAADQSLANDQFELVSLVNGQPVVSVQASAECYRDFVRDGIECQALRFSTEGLFSVLSDVQWLGEKQASGFGRSQVSVSPTLRYAVATEYGVWDYSLGLATNLYTPLWSGAAIDVRHVTPMKNSDDYEDGYWEDSAFESGVDRMVAHQAVVLPFGARYQLTAGVIRTDYQGYKHDLAWYSPAGRHAFTWQYSAFEHRDEEDQYGRPYEEKTVNLAGYTYSHAEWDWQLNLLGGQFWGGDEGYQVTTNHWFGDVNIYATYLNSARDERDAEEFLTLGISLPIDFWRGMKPRYLQVRGIDQYNFDLQTRIGDDHNYINSGLGGSVKLQHSLKRQYLNRGRYGANYFESQQVRLRNAYLRYLGDDSVF